MSDALPYVTDCFAPRRRVTREVRVGDVGIGGANPIRVQSMTTTDTLDVAATVAQAERMAAAGCEIVRITAPSVRDAEALGEIAAELRRRGVRAPLVADIHFTPKAALIAAEHVDKVRVNPGNYADKKKFAVREYTDLEYAAELHRVAERFRPLVRRCRELGRAMRIGTNHGSLSDRIMNRYGDTPQGMVESAIEFLDVCEDEGFRDVVFSMKASNAQVAVQAYRLLAARLAERAPGEPGYPFHLGVTEAGEGEDGRVKSAIGIGALLEDGIGDTIRVSLTEDPVREVPVARALARHYEARLERAAALPPIEHQPSACVPADPYTHTRRATRSAGGGELAIGGSSPVRAERELGPVPEDAEAAARELEAALARAPELPCEGLIADAPDAEALERLQALSAALVKRGIEAPIAARVPAALAPRAAKDSSRVIVRVAPETPDVALGAAARTAGSQGVALEWSLEAGLHELAPLLDRALTASAAAGVRDLIVSAGASQLPVHAVRVLAARLAERGAGDVPIALRHHRAEGTPDDDTVLQAAADLGGPLCDGIGDAVSLSGIADPARALDLTYRILQGARRRTTRTEYISCPSCGRTLFDLEETTARIRARTGHLSGVKIAVMGCIVNGPGEMADADFGYVGSGPGLVNLYVGKQCVARHVPQSEADDRLIHLIRTHNRWTDPSPR